MTKATLHMGTVSLDQISTLLNRILGGQDGTHSRLPIGDKKKKRELFKNVHLNCIRWFCWVQLNGSNPNSTQPQCWKPNRSRHFADLTKFSVRQRN
jgi:hypothetical protein